MAGRKPAAVQQRQAGGVCYQLARRRVKNLNLRVRSDGTVAVSIPMRAAVREADAFVLAHRDWIEAAVQRQLRRAARPLPDRDAALARFTALSRQVFPLLPGRWEDRCPSSRCAE